MAGRRDTPPAPGPAAPDPELAHLRFVVANQADRIARLERDLANERMGHHVMRRLWEEGVPPGWRCWRIRRRAEARYAATAHHRVPAEVGS